MKLKDYLLFFLSLFVFTCSICFATMYSTISLNQSIYHLKVPISGGNIQVFYAFLFRVLPITLIIYIIFYLLFKNYNIKSKYINFKNKKIQIFPLNYLTKYNKIFSISLIIFSLIYICSYLNVGTYLINQFRTTNLYEEYYVDSNNVKITFPKQKRNLIYIYVESLENTYASKDIGGNQVVNLMPELSNLALNNINFSNTDKLGGALQVKNTEWTAAALIAQTSGLPLNLPLTSPIYDTDDYFFPNTLTLGDILENNGYKNVFLLGSDSTFGGRKSYFENHGNYKIRDLKTIKKDGILDEDYFVWWGFEDSKLFDYAKDELNDLSKNKEPFNLTILTSDTHFVDGYLEKDCEEKYTNNISNVVACSSNLINNFISWVKEQDFYENTTIIISGDHLYMDSYYLNANNYTRTIYNTFINSVIEPINNHNRLFSTLDMFPTTLASLGVKIDGNRLGLGTNLFSDQKTIIEKIGLDEFNEEIQKESDIYMELLKKDK